MIPKAKQNKNRKSSKGAQMPLPPTTQLLTCYAFTPWGRNAHNKEEIAHETWDKKYTSACLVLGSRKNGRLLFSGTGSAGGSGIPAPAPAAASSPAALSAVEILTLGAAVVAPSTLAIVTRADLPSTGACAGLRFRRATGVGIARIGWNGPQC